MLASSLARCHSLVASRSLRAVASRSSALLSETPSAPAGLHWIHSNVPREPSCVRCSLVVPPYVAASSAAFQLRRASSSTNSAAGAAQGKKNASTAAHVADCSPSDKALTEPSIIFAQAWSRILAERGERAMVFPKEIIWLAGAPGAGKGTMSSFICELRGLTAKPIETSGLFSGAEAQKYKDSGTLIGDREVVEAVLRALLRPENSTGVIVDGFPRTSIQAECIKLLYDHMVALRHKHIKDVEMSAIFRRPVFHMTVLYVDEEESIRRQMYRGEQLDKTNRRNMDLGVGKVLETRPTDVSKELAAKRYRVFKEEVVSALHSIKDSFQFHLIDADKTPDEVKSAIEGEFEYQSSLELGDDTFELVRNIKTSTEIVMHARQKLVQRLNAYTREHKPLFEEVIELLNTSFMHIVERQALMGAAVVRSNSPLLNNPVALNMVLDLLAERGYYATLDVMRIIVPLQVDPYIPGSSAPQNVRTRVVKSFVFKITFKRPKIRHRE